jgi:predicted dehydrogenase
MSDATAKRPNHSTKTSAQTAPATQTSATRATTSRLRFAVVGYGYWGPQLVRNLDRIPNAEVARIVDLSAERRQRARTEFPGTQVVGRFEEALESDVDAVVIATPIRTHYKLAKQALEQGKHVLVEKPLTASSAEAQELIALAESVGCVLMVGHTFMYNPAVETLRHLVQEGAVGKVLYIDSSRTNLGIFQPDINVMWDLAPHDISILCYILDQAPVSVSAHGGAYVQPGIHDVVYMTLNFPNGAMAQVHVSWLNPAKIRRFTVVGDKLMVIYDDVEATEKIRIFDRGVDKPPMTSTFGEFQLSYRYGNIVSPYIAWTEPLGAECRHFIQAILEDTTPRSDARNGLLVVRVLEAAETSLANGGAAVEINHGLQGESD